MSDSEAYLRELRRALPIWCRRRLLAEVAEHFAQAIAAEAERGVPTVEAEQLTVRRLGPAQALADQLLADLRSGALGRAGRFAVTLTATRLAAFATVTAIAVVLGAALVIPRSSSQPPALQRAAVSEGAADRACRVDGASLGNDANRVPILVTVAEPGATSVAPGAWRAPGVSRWPIGRSKGGPAMQTTVPACLVTVAKPGEIQVAAGVWRPARLSH